MAPALYDSVYAEQDRHHPVPLLATGRACVLYSGLGCRHSLMRFEVRQVSPAEAAKLLQTNTINRPISRRNLEFFEEQLRRGEMLTTHQGIAVSSSGKLLDGQHRLTAIVNTGISVTMLVATDVPDETFSVLDTGRIRRAADVLSITGAANATALAAGIRLYLCYRDCPDSNWAGSKAAVIATATAINTAYENNKDNWKYAAYVSTTFKLNGIAVAGPMTCLIFLALTHCKFSREYLKNFAKTLKEGIGLESQDPILAYRSRMISGVRDTRSNGQARLADYIKLFNAYTTGQKLKLFKSQPFPPMPSMIHASESIHENALAQ